MDPMPGVGPNGVVFPGGAGGGAVIGRPGYYYPVGQFQRLVPVRLKLGEKKAKQLKELSGNIPVQMLAPPEAIITVENVLKAAGSKTQGKHGGEIEVVGIEKQANGEYKVQIRLQQPPNVNFNVMPAPVQIMPAQGGNAQIQIGIAPAQPGGGRVPAVRNVYGLPMLVDAKGKEYELVAIPQQQYRGAANGMVTREVTMVFRARQGQGEPAQLVLTGSRPVSVPVPFTLRDVSLQAPAQGGGNPAVPVPGVIVPDGPPGIAIPLPGGAPGAAPAVPPPPPRR
jgi:hypothetical protein